MPSVTLSPELTTILAAEAERTGKTLSTLAEEWLRHQYQMFRRKQLALQTKRFWANHAVLYTKYPNQYVAFYNDKVLDHDDNMRELALRVRAAHGDLPLVIAQVTPDRIVSYQVRSPCLQQDQPKLH